jgi:hypothetical protein
MVLFSLNVLPFIPSLCSTRLSKICRFNLRFCPLLQDPLPQTTNNKLLRFQTPKFPLYKLLLLRTPKLPSPQTPDSFQLYLRPFRPFQSHEAFKTMFSIRTNSFRPASISSGSLRQIMFHRSAQFSSLPTNFVIGSRRHKWIPGSPGVVKLSGSSSLLILSGASSWLNASSIAV